MATIETLIRREKNYMQSILNNLFQDSNNVEVIYDDSKNYKIISYYNNKISIELFHKKESNYFKLTDFKTDNIIYTSKPIFKKLDFTEEIQNLNQKLIEKYHKK